MRKINRPIFLKNKLLNKITKFFLLSLVSTVIHATNSNIKHSVINTNAIKHKTKVVQQSQATVLNNVPNDIDQARSLSAVGTGPFFGIGSSYDGSDLVVLQPNIHKDVGLLKQHQRTAKFTGEYCGPRSPYVQFSGYAEAQATLENKSNNHIDLTASNLDITAWVNSWLTAYSNFGVETEDTNNQNFRMITGFITIGNFNSSPFYLSAGQMFIPFGSFSSGTSSVGTIPRSVGRIVEQAISAGYYSEDNGWHVSGAVYDGRTQNSKHDNVDQFAGTVQYNKSLDLYTIPSSIKAGVSYTNNIADSAVMRTAFVNNATLEHFVPAYDVFAKVNVGPVIGRWEYLTATRNFALTDLVQKGKSVKPASFMTELEYDTFILGKGTGFVLHYSRVSQAAVASATKHQYGVNTSVNVLRNTIVSLEYSNRANYSAANIISSLPPVPSPANLNPFRVNQINNGLDGKRRNYLVLTLDLFF